MDDKPLQKDGAFVVSLEWVKVHTSDLVLSQGTSSRRHAW